MEFLKSLGRYGEIRWEAIKWQWLAVGIVIMGGLISTKNYKKRLPFLTGNGKEMVYQLAGKGYYQQAKEISQKEKIEGVAELVEPKIKLEKEIKRQKRLLRESPYLGSALENLARLYERLGEQNKAKGYRKLIKWIGY